MDDKTISLRTVHPGVETANGGHGGGGAGGRELGGLTRRAGVQHGDRRGGRRHRLRDVERLKVQPDLADAVAAGTNLKGEEGSDS